MLPRSTSADSLIPEVFVRDVLLAGGDGARGVTKADFDAAVEAARKNLDTAALLHALGEELGPFERQLNGLDQGILNIC
jgi:hypothetical protein